MFAGIWDALKRCMRGRVDPTTCLSAKDNPTTKAHSKLTLEDGSGGFTEEDLSWYSQGCSAVSAIQA